MPLDFSSQAQPLDFSSGAQPLDFSSFGFPIDAFNGPDAEKASNGSSSLINGVQDIARFFLPIATTGVNAIGGGVGQAAAGGSFIEGLKEGAQKEDILGFDLGMETDIGKAVEGKMGEAFQSLHNLFGKESADLFKDENKRALIKGIPGVGALAGLYEFADDDGKRTIEAAANGIGAAGPDLMLALLGGKGAKSVTKKLEDGSTINAAELARQYADEPLIPENEKASSFGPLDYERPEIGLAPEESFTPATNPQTGAELPKYEGGVDFDFGGLDTVKQDNIPLQQVPDSPQIDLPLIPRGKETDLRFKGNQYLRPDETEALVAPDFSVDPRQQSLPFEDGVSAPINSPNKPLGQTAFGRKQRGSIGFTPKPHTIEELATRLNREEWGAKFAEQNPQFKDRPDVIDRVYDSLNQRGNGGKPPVRNLAQSIEDSPILKGLDKFLGVVSTRIGNISQPVLHRAMEFERGLLKNTHNKISRVDGFIEGLNGLPKNVRSIVDNALLDNDYFLARHALSKSGAGHLAKGLDEVQKVLKETGDELISTNSLDGLRDEYFPRIVEDIRGLKNALGQEHKSAIELRISEKKKKLGRDLDEIEQSQIVNSYLRGTMKGQYRPGFTKGRKFDTIPEELKQFYATPTQSLHTYLRNAVQEMETAKFFGRDLIKKEGRPDLDTSIGNFVAREQREGKINGDQAAELGEMLRSRFGPGNRSSGVVMQTARDIANMGILGNFISTITQAGDVINAGYLNGFIPTISAVAQLAMGKNKLSMKDFGLIDNISAEFVNQRKSTRFLNKIFRATGFQQLDHLGKNTILNGAYNQAARMIKSPKGLKEFQRLWGPRFGDEFPQLVKDLREGKVTDLTQAYAFAKLAKIQPITKLELPQKYLDVPNGRMMYMLKSFAIKQMDLVRNDAFNEIKKGNTRKGIGNLLKFATVLGISGASTDYIKDWIMGREVDPELSDVPLNVLKTFSYNEYIHDMVMRGEPGKAAISVVAPPVTMLDPLFKDAKAEFDGDPFTEASGRSVNYLPIAGRILYERFLGGAEKHDEKQFQRQILGED